MRRQEERFHTDEQVRAVIAEALAIVSEFEIDDELKVPVFMKAAELLAAKQVFFEQPQAVALDPRFLHRS